MKLKSKECTKYEFGTGKNVLRTKLEYKKVFKYSIAPI